ncbi:MAG: asparagine synthase (glutamine-hydrolyzing) [bacterium]
MCGITGYRVLDGDARPWAEGLPRAVTSLQRRGPDDSGVWFGAGQRVGLGHRRLSILDLSAHGHQPMTSACGNWHMVFNGAVYNFKALRAELEPLGHRCAGRGDAEVILAAFAQWGPDAVTRFVGMFSIALWHVPTQRLHLLRDRLGVKPLYYRWDGDALCFGSELKALRAFDWPPVIDRDALLDYLRYGYIAAPRTIYERVSQLPPAHRLVLDERGGPQLHRYWNVLDHVGRRHDRSEDELADELEALMTDAFEQRMIADVPVGVFLSGGVDSSLLAALLQKRGGRQIKTFTIGFDRPEYDESRYASDVARHLGTDHTCRVVGADDVRHLLPRWADLYDEPFGDESGLATFLASQLAAEQVKVVLSADGGDELFGGYASYTAALQQWAWIEKLPLGLRRAAAAAIGGVGASRIDGYLSARPGSVAGRLVGSPVSMLAKLGARIDARGIGEVFDRALAHFACAELATLIGRSDSTRDDAEVYPGAAGEKLCLWDLHHYLPGDVLTKVDRATMAMSLEGREPLLDHRLVEFAFSLPFILRRGSLGPKHLLKKVLHRHVPPALVERPKRGFALPLKEWLASELRGCVDRYLDPRHIAQQGLFDPVTVGRYVRRLHAGDVAVCQRIWLLLAFQLWHERWAS